MSTPGTAVQPVERQDIHKACRTIEALLTVLNDYCEAASAFATIQKKLSKALKDTAGLKTNPQFAANAFSASSIILEVLADVDNKFAKMAVKESHSISSEVKKWFKKMTKEEKAHDERMDESNVRIKQAGQSYEKKSKKGAKDAGEEHTRYINLLSVIGPEMSQEKYNHAVHVSQQNTLVTFNVGATLSRIADAEWSRICECMRRISPTVGPLGEWRSLCEGAWTGPLPDDLPEVSSGTTTLLPSTAAISEWGQTGLSTPVPRSLPIPPASASHSPASVSAPTSASLDPPRSPFASVSQNQGSVNSITTLSAFPFPPTHFPVPLAMSEAEFQRQQTQLQNLQSRAGSPNLAQSQGVLAPAAPILTDSPKQTAAELRLDVSKSSQSSQVSQTTSTSHQSNQDTRELPSTEPSTIPPEGKEVAKPVMATRDPKKSRRPSFIARVPPPSDKIIRPIPPFKRADFSSGENDFGVHADSSRSATKSQSVDAAMENLGRADSTHSTGNHVAALRHKYTRTVETPSQGPKDIPRLPMSVSEIASRYQPIDEPLSPRRTASPVVERFPPDTPASTSPRDFAFDENEIRGRKQRIEELAELELKEKEYELRQRERDLDQRTRDFERDRRQFLNSRPDPASAADGPKGPRTSPFKHKRGSQSVTHVNLPSSTSSSGGLSTSVARPSTSHSPVLPPKDHAPFCGCDTCSVSKYKVSDAAPSPRDLRPPEPPILLRPEKPKGWIRRLSMPSVNVAFSLDAKKNASALSLKAGLPLPAENGRLRKRSYEQGIGNRSMMRIGR